MQNRRKVMIVDDEMDLCLLLKTYSVNKGFEVFLSHTLKEGLSTLQNVHPDIIFMDNNLPDGDGWSAAKKISIDFPETYIILISAYHASPSDLQQSAHLKVIEKPISKTDLDKHFATIG